MRIDVRDISYSYDSRPVLSRIDCRIHSGEIFCIVGPNGSGKTTLAKCMDGLLIPKSGSIFLGDKNIQSLNPVERARLVGYVSQSSAPCFSTTVFETVMMGRRPHEAWHSSREDVCKVADILRSMNLAQEAFRDITRLSGGQRQRVFIARALAQEPRSLILDEPTSALDIAHQLDTMDTLTKLAHTRGLSVAIILHDLNLAARYADRVMMLFRGRVHALGAPQEVFTSQNMETVYGVNASIHKNDKFVYIFPMSRCRSTPEIPE